MGHLGSRGLARDRRTSFARRAVLIVKPYGRSEVSPADAKSRRRVLSLRDRSGAALNIETFALEHDDLVIAQWISIIDKIARKPAAGKGATLAQFRFREKLGKAAWQILDEGSRLRGAADPDRREHLQMLWSWKVAPYGPTVLRSKRGRPEPTAKGKWYDRFSGGVADVAAADAAAIARRIEIFLYESEFSARGATRRKEGLIPSRARSIARNVARPPTPSHGGGYGNAWSLDDEERYAKAGNVALTIRMAAETREAGKRQASPDLAAEALYGHYAKLFVCPDGRVMMIGEARDGLPALFQLHVAIKDTYARLLERRRHVRSKDAVLPEQQRPFSMRLPRTMEALYELVDAKGLNRDLNGLVRLGKVIHYEAANGGADRTQSVVANWPADVTNCHSWTSDGQLLIKRNEAFVRIWRRLLSLAGRTLTDWVDHRATIGNDILMKKQKLQAVGQKFNGDTQKKKLDLLLGRRAPLFQFPNDSEQRELLSFTLEAVYRLRNAAFHFTGFGGFAEAVTSCCRDATPAIDAALRSLWEQDSAERSQLGTAIARSAQFDLFWNQDQVSRLVDAASMPSTAPLPLPRFTRVLKRAADALSELDDPANQLFMPSGVELSDPATFCRYQALKILYDGPFRDWLHGRDPSFVNRLIERACERATGAARALNAGEDERRQKLIVARASHLGRLNDGETVAEFFFRLSAESATEFRVQQAYQSDQERARSQADYIEKLKADLVALGFGAFLSDQGYGFVLNLEAGTMPATTPPFDIPTPPYVQSATPNAWQLGLYFLLHLVPVDDVVRLLHQVQRWEGGANAAGQPETAALQAILSLYADMHDTKFEGGGLAPAEPLKAFYERPSDFDRIFPILGSDEQRLCRRGLREVLRFGHLQPLQSVFSAQPVTAVQVEEYLVANQTDATGSTPIARLQAEREILHAHWVEKGRDFSTVDRDRYRTVLSKVVRFRHLSTHVTFISHIRLHRLLVAACARLVDFSGLWERDLYFVTIALIHLEHLTPKQALGSDGARWLRRGQIIQALRDASEGGHLPPMIASVLRAHFTEVWKKASRATSIRNDIAHFNMLRQGVTPDLTYWTNKTRELLRHDRKLRNAVPASIRELLRQNGLDIGWMLQGDGHRLGPSLLVTRQARHLRSDNMMEDLNGRDFVAMAAALFGDCRPVAPTVSKVRGDRAQQRPATRTSYPARSV